MPLVPVLRRLRQDDHKFKASLGYTATPSLKKTSKGGGGGEGRGMGEQEPKQYLHM
jgi:hypothetical protein